jgi:uncharacterized protein (UPF0248 family)
MHNYLDFPLIEKEDLKNHSFPEKDVLSDLEAKKNRAQKLHKATSLGNLEHKRVHIIFQDEEGIKRLYTTLWAHVDNKIIMRDAIILPAHRVVDIVFDE